MAAFAAGERFARGLIVVEDGVPLAVGAALDILTGQPHGDAIFEDAGKG